MRRPTSTLIVAVTVACSIVVGTERASAADAVSRVYLPNIVKMLGGPDGWTTPFIVQNIGTTPTDVLLEFFRFSDGTIAKYRQVKGLAPGTSVVHSPNSDDELAAGGQYAVVVTSFSAPVVAVVNEHQGEANPRRQEALSYEGLTLGSTRVYLPRVAVSIGGWYCTIIIQNFGPPTATVTAEFKSFDGLRTAQVMRSVPGLSSKFIDPRFEGALVAGNEYSVSLVSKEAIGAVVNCHNDDASVMFPRAYSYNGILPTSETQLFVPYAIGSGAGPSSRLMIQNVGLLPARPRVFVSPLDGSGSNRVDAPTTLAPGAVWTYDLGFATPAAERTAVIEGGQFAVLVETLSLSSAMAYTGTTEGVHRLYLPNVTRTLGGANGWTTPIVVQTHGAFVATVRWYRFADGALVHTQRVTFGPDFGDAVKIDPRDVTALTDDSQYAVVIEASFGGVGATVLELSGRGGDGAMSYGGMTLPPSNVIGIPSCSPTTAPAGSVFRCTFYGFEPGTRPVTERFSPPGSSGTVDEPVGSDGRWLLSVRGLTAGEHTVSVTAGNRTFDASFTVTAPTFALRVARSANGSLSLESKPGATCRAEARLPSGRLSTAAALAELRIVDAAGVASWTYPSDSEAGVGLHYAECNFGAETLVIGSQYSLP